MAHISLIKFYCPSKDFWLEIAVLEETRDVFENWK